MGATAFPEAIGTHSKEGDKDYRTATYQSRVVLPRHTCKNIGIVIGEGKNAALLGSNWLFKFCIRFCGLQENVFEFRKLFP